MSDMETTAYRAGEKQGLGQQWAVAAGHPLAVRAAQRMLELKGTAVDAAIAADAVMGVVEPMATGIGGDLLAMIAPPDSTPVAYNGSGAAPLLLTAHQVQALPGERIPERHVLSITTPGLVRGWWDMHQRYGRLAWASLFQPAIEAAREGFAVAPVAAREWHIFDFVLHRDPACAALYRAGNPPKAGERYVNPELALVLQEIAEQGPDAFYLGRPAQQAERAMKQVRGLLRAQDFQRHQGFFCEPVSTALGDFSLFECPPNTHGVAVLEAVQAAWHRPADEAAAELALVQATEAAMAQASRVVCDPAGNTVCTVVVDGQGLAVTFMSSIFKRFGSGYAVPGCGFVLQNRGFGFSGPGHVNGPGPGKRPYHTVVPSVALRSGRFHMGLGVVGGLMQPQGQIQIWTRVLRDGWPLERALFAPRWRLEAAGRLALEEGFDAHCAAFLRGSAYGPPDKGVGELAGRSDFGGAQAVERLADGRLKAVSDPRKDGCVALG
ncbi:gamma-glutamyltransferase family protein [Alcaligenes ammonioxydans]|uniref:gamma-glutamyltransferase family protein n=1 Tax=Alcaligenes ammonioxydans TaxID=2582914 RepID=UPI001F06FD07|nr:gamma-glutamyltransferase [Alcaligenes ammonioxydans]MCH1879805.1 gamma-glutamyltransferase family protein [Alcaligenes ammonioxydans]